MAKYRKKPVVIEAEQWDGTYTDKQRIDSVFLQLSTLRIEYNPHFNTVSTWKIGTLEGGHEVSKGDYIIKGVAGEFYPCKSDIFQKTYEPA
jgi:hypothetical protein